MNDKNETFITSNIHVPIMTNGIATNERVGGHGWSDPPPKKKKIKNKSKMAYGGQIEFRKIIITP